MRRAEARVDDGGGGGGGPSSGCGVLAGLDTSLLRWCDGDEANEGAPPSVPLRPKKQASGVLREVGPGPPPPELPESVLASILRRVASLPGGGIPSVLAAGAVCKGGDPRGRGERWEQGVHPFFTNCFAHPTPNFASHKAMEPWREHRPCAAGWRHAAHAPDLWRDIFVKRFGPFEVDISDADNRESCRRVVVSPMAPYYYVRGRWWRAIRKVRSYRVLLHSPDEMRRAPPRAATMAPTAASLAGVSGVSGAGANAGAAYGSDGGAAAAAGTGEVSGDEVSEALLAEFETAVSVAVARGWDRVMFGIYHPTRMGPTAARLFIGSVNAAFPNSGADAADDGGGGVGGVVEEADDDAQAASGAGAAGAVQRGGSGSRGEEDAVGVGVLPPLPPFDDVNTDDDDEDVDENEDDLYAEAVGGAQGDAGHTEGGYHGEDNVDDDVAAGEDDEDSEDEDDGEEDEGFVSSFEVDVHKSAVSVTEHALVLMLPGLTRKKLESLTVIRDGGKEWVRVTVSVCKGGGGGGGGGGANKRRGDEEVSADEHVVLCEFWAPVGRVLLPPRSSSRPTRRGGAGGSGGGEHAPHGKSASLDGMLIVDGFVHIMHRAPPTFCREVFSGAGRVPGRCLPGWGSADPQWVATAVPKNGDDGGGRGAGGSGGGGGGGGGGGDKNRRNGENGENGDGDYFGGVGYGYCAFAKMKQSSVIQSISDGCSSYNAGEMVRGLMEVGRDESTTRVNIARREFAMALTFTSDAEILAGASGSRSGTGLGYAITSSPAVTVSSLPLPHRMLGTSLATFKFGNGEAAAVMSVLERCPPEQLGGLRCSVTFTHKSGRAHLSAVGLPCGDSGRKTFASLGSRAGYHSLTFGNIADDSGPHYRVLERGGDRFGAGAGGNDHDDYVLHPLRVELDCVIVGVGHSLLVTMPLPPLLGTSRALESEN
jgi:hypothetical protein